MYQDRVCMGGEGQNKREKKYRLAGRRANNVGGGNGSACVFYRRARFPSGIIMTTGRRR